ncbi:hypothetical protein B0H17DRAFT_1138604 [Mycena rosella]|uniref:Glucose-methanol-choline oxidoreductase N-terminal domain-containing protein n=1 Tax=Mycena rosella TaxID=1033263 RepID=A0AAD7D636_MYCRO|nr:hypothetical protein B0H17DRAFT_1138604 [Mycena rosella]
MDVICKICGCPTPSPGDQNPPSGDSDVPLGEFIHTGKTLKVDANKEVILSGGIPDSILRTPLVYTAIKSPQILELSGIGRKEILKNIGVECKVDLRGVGQNVQNHTYCTPVYGSNRNA